MFYELKRLLKISKIYNLRTDQDPQTRLFFYFLPASDKNQGDAVPQHSFNF